MAVMTDSLSRHAEFKLATNTSLSDFPNVEAKREEQRNCLKHVVGEIYVFAISPPTSYFPAFSSNKACVGMKAG